MRNRRAGSRFGGGIKDVWVGKGVGTGRADGKQNCFYILAHIYRFIPYADRTIRTKPSGPNPKVHSDGCLFHVKQCLFLPRFHVKQSCFSVTQTAARPIPSPACHSERSEESPNYKANPSSTCGDSSSQAPQNDKEKRNAGVSCPE